MVSQPPSGPVQKTGRISFDFKERHLPGIIVTQHACLMHIEVDTLPWQAGLHNVRVMQNGAMLAAHALPSLHLVMHLAGAPAGGAVYVMPCDVSNFGFQSKIIGFHHIDSLFVLNAVHAACLFSSLATCLGSVGSTVYSAASGCMNNAIEWSPQSGDAFQSIEWGPWLAWQQARAFLKNWVPKAFFQTH